MKKPSDNFIIGTLVPATAIAAILFSTVTMVAFRLGQMTVGFILSLFSIVAWVALLVEFFLVYQTLIDRWFAKDRSALTAVWFVVSLWLAFLVTPDKAFDWGTAIVFVSLFAVIFLIPYIIGMAYGDRIKAFLRKSPVIKRRKLQKNDAEEYEQKISNLNTELVKGLPPMLQTNDALFLLILFQEDGYLNEKFLPVITKESNEINQTLYAFIADVIATALKVKSGKWTVFENFWSLNNAAQLLSNLNKTTKGHPTEHQRQVAKLMRKATRLRPRLQTEGIAEFLSAC